MHTLLASDTKYLTTLKIRTYCMDLEGFPVVTTQYSVSPTRKFSIYVISLGNDQVDSLASTQGHIGHCYIPRLSLSY